MLSVFTPSHDPTYLDECLASLQAQTFTDWEWVVLLNHGAQWTPETDDPRVHVIVADPQTSGIGALKREAVSDTVGEILVELDHDDLLATTCLAKVAGVFDVWPGVGFVYSDCAEILPDGTRSEDTFNLAHGWDYYDTEVDGRPVKAVRALEPSPHNVSLIWYAPNHVRAFRRHVYEKAGGYDPERTVLDDQDLMCRLYQLTDFAHIDECLYLQRVHPGSTQRHAETNARIQTETVQLYDVHVQPNALAWANRRSLAALDLGAAHGKPDGYLGVDQYLSPGVDIVCDVADGVDLPDSSVGVIRAVDFLEHVPDTVGLFEELYRLLAHGGMLLSLTPSTDGRGAWQDPTHVAFLNENSFWYFTDAAYAGYVPEIKCRFQVSRLATLYPTPWHEEHRIPYVQANLIAVKDGPRQGGILAI